MLDQVSLSTPSNKSKPYLIILILIALIVILGVGVFFVYRPRTDEQTSNPGVTKPLMSRDQGVIKILLSFANKSLNQRYQLISLSDLDTDKNGDKTKSIQINGRPFIIKAFMSHTDTSLLETILTEEKHDVNNLETVLSVFNRYFNMSETQPSDWKIRTITNGNSYEIVIDNPDGSYDTRSAYAVRDSQGRYLIGVAACHISQDYPQFGKRSCIRIE